MHSASYDGTLAKDRARILRAAFAELVLAGEWYRRRNVSAGVEFRQAFEDAARRIAEFPNSGTPYLHGTRQVVLSRYSYRIVYVIRDQEPIIVAVAHTSGRPGYWRDRLDE